MVGGVSAKRPDDRFISEISPKEQVERVVGLEVAVSVQQRLLALLATSWDAETVRSAVLPYHYLIAPFMPAVVLQRLAASPSWEVRYLVALHEHTPAEIMQQ